MKNEKETKPILITDKEFKEINDKHDNPAEVIIELLELVGKKRGKYENKR